MNIFSKYGFRRDMCRLCKLHCSDISFCYAMYEVIKDDFVFIYNTIQANHKKIISAPTHEALSVICQVCTLRNECIIDSYDSICTENIFKQLVTDGENCNKSTTNMYNYVNCYYSVVATQAVSDKRMLNMFHRGI